MSFARISSVTFVLGVAIATAAPVRAEQYNTFWTDNAQTYVYSSTCGSTQTSSGCYGFASLGPFRQACAIVSTPVVSTAEADGSVANTRRILVMDRGAQAGDAVTLSVFSRISIASRDNILTTTRLIRTVTLPLFGGPEAKCSMARNAAGTYVGTTQSPNAVRVDDNFALTVLPGFSPALPVDRITSTPGGNVAVTHKDSVSSGFYLFRNDGALLMSGGGENFVIETGNAVKLGPDWTRIVSYVSGPATRSGSTELKDGRGLSVGTIANPIVRDASGAPIFADGKWISQPAH